MYLVYILQSVNYPDKLYKRYTTNIEKRINAHNSGSCSSTAKNKPWKLIFHCAFLNKKKALDFEKYLKSASGIAFMRKRLIDNNID